MTVQKLFVKNIYDGNGSNKIFPFTFECPENHPEYIHVYVKLDNVSTETDNFSVDMEGHNITYPVTGEALEEGGSLIIVRELPLHQVLNLVNQGPFFADDIEVTFDEMVMMIQQLNEKLERTSSLDISSDGGAFDTTLPVKAGYTWRVNDEGTGFVPATNPDTVATDIKAALTATETKVEKELAGTKTYVDNSLNETTTSINTDLENTKTDVATSLNETESKINTALDETMAEIDKKEKAIQELIDSLGGLTIEALVAVRNQCLQKAAEAQGAADTALEAAEGLQSAVAQVQTNTTDISTLNTNKANVADVYTKTDTDTLLSAKLGKQQGVENAGKNLVVGEDGNVILGDGGGHVIVPAKPSPADAKENVVYFTIENGKAKGYIKNGDTMAEIGSSGDGIPIGTVVSWAYSLGNIPQGFSRYDDTHIIADRDIPSSDMFVTQAKQIAEINTILNPDASGVVYGFRIDNTEADPYASVIYLRDAIGMEPAYMDYARGRFDYGSWENAFFMPKPCMLQYDGTVAYYLDPNNYAYREDGVTPSDITNDNFNGNAMMEWGQNGKKIWYKIEPIADGRANIFIADHKEDDGFVCYSFIGGSNQELEHFYTPIYNGSNVSSRLRSLSGKRQMVSNSGATEIAYAKANGNGWYIEQWCDRTLINFLLILMGKSLDTQKVFGNGHYSGGSAEGSNLSTGTMNGKGMFWGSNGNDGVKVFGMENWWANTWRRTAGLINNKGTYYVKMTPNTYDGSTITTYDDSGNGAGYVAMGSVPSASQSYIKTYSFNDKCMLPSTMGGASNTYYCDGMWSNNGQIDFALVGGSSANGAICGAFAVDLSDVLGHASWSNGASLSYKHS